MATRKQKFVPGEYYHIYNRGNSKQPLFLDPKDYDHFIKCLFVCNTKKHFKFRDNIKEKNIDAFDFDRGEPLVEIGAWVLMPNHFHIYLTMNPHMSDMWEKNPVTEFMRKLSTAYVKYFNAKYKRTGGLFEGAFKSTFIETDTQAQYLFSYIHLNPLKLIDPLWKEKGSKIDSIDYTKFLDTYVWSSYIDYKKVIRKENTIINTKAFPPYFLSLKDFNKEILSWIRR